jgi:hypothetical protein
MKKNKIAIVLVIVLGAASFWYFQKRSNGTISENMRNFAVADVTTIDKIFLADKNGRNLTLEKDEQGAWKVNGKFKPREDVISTLLETMKRMDVKEPVGKNAQDNVIKRLAAKAVKCEIYQNNVLTKAYYIGSETQDQKGTFAIMIDVETMKPVEKPFVVYIPGFDGYLTTRYFTEEEGWRDRSMFEYKPTDIKSIKVEVPNDIKLGYELTVKGNNDYELKKLGDNSLLENVDPISVKQYLSYFQLLSFESFEVDITPTQKDSVMKSQPINIITVTDNAGQVNKVKFFARAPKLGAIDATGKLLKYDAERMDALLNNGKDFVMVQYFMFGKVMPPVEYFQKGNAPSGPVMEKPVTKPKA